MKFGTQIENKDFSNYYYFFKLLFRPIMWFQVRSSSDHGGKKSYHIIIIWNISTSLWHIDTKLYVFVIPHWPHHINLVTRHRLVKSN